MKEDILEQIVADWFVAKNGWFVKHNVKYRPSTTNEHYEGKRDSVHSDIDILAFSPLGKGVKRVAVVTCKSWQGGFATEKWLRVLEGDHSYNERTERFQKREEWKYFRELVSPKWQEAFLRTIKEQTGKTSFTYYIAVTKIAGRNAQDFRRKIEVSKIIRNRFEKQGAKVSIEIITLEEITKEIIARFDEKLTPSVEATDVGRMLQLLKVAEVIK
ncbi:MAG: hypothetical protein Q7L07_01590 [Pseudohongiella sp.]|nr:hypothetical protein [Pseudohongiella sp.]